MDGTTLIIGENLSHRDATLPIWKLQKFRGNLYRILLCVLKVILLLHLTSHKKGFSNLLWGFLIKSPTSHLLSWLRTNYILISLEVHSLLSKFLSINNIIMYFKFKKPWFPIRSFPIIYIKYYYFFIWLIFFSNSSNSSNLGE